MCSQFNHCCCARVNSCGTECIDLSHSRTVDCWLACRFSTYRGLVCWWGNCCRRRLVVCCGKSASETNLYPDLDLPGMAFVCSIQFMFALYHEVNSSVLFHTHTHTHIQIYAHTHEMVQISVQIQCRHYIWYHCWEEVLKMMINAAGFWVFSIWVSDLYLAFKLLWPWIIFCARSCDKWSSIFQQWIGIRCFLLIHVTDRL